ncbi:MAG: type II secretion system protein [Actinomycetota bacterium]
MFTRFHRPQGGTSRDAGFTLIELLVVMIIIGILAGIAIPVFANQRKKAVDASMKSDLQSLAKELESYRVNNPAYPAGATGTGTISVAGTAVPLSTGNTLTVVTTVGAGVVAGTYCITAANTKGSQTLYFDSDRGGIRTTPCA